jgi:serine/threonine protein kinase
MVDENYYIKLIDFGEAKIVDNYEEESKYSSQGNSEYGGRHGSKSGSSDGKSSYFGRMLRSGNKRNGIPKAGTFVGTPLYAAPEMLESNQSGLYTDLWALGCIIYEMACGNKMFRGKNNQEVFNKILDQDYEFPSSMDKDAVDLIQKLVQIEPMMRLGLKNTQVLKNHPFFKGINFENLQA